MQRIFLIQQLLLLPELAVKVKTYQKIWKIPIIIPLTKVLVTKAILQQDICGNYIDPTSYRISALNLSNSAAIVLYEALRQTDFPGM